MLLEKSNVGKNWNEGKGMSFIIQSCTQPGLVSPGISGPNQHCLYGLRCPEMSGSEEEEAAVWWPGLTFEHPLTFMSMSAPN